MPGIAGTAGYNEAADVLVRQYETLTFEDVHADVLHLLPDAPGRVLDVGAGSGRDAAALARLGHRVVAVEPARELRERARRLHADAPVTWIDDALPELEAVHRGGRRFDLVLLSAVWMHLDGDERARAMKSVASLLVPGGRVVLTLRHGPVPPARRMFDVPVAETVALAEVNGLHVVHRGTRGDLLGRPGLRWSVLGLQPF
ncbi:class I SAM-dependent methyltransferase [Actinomadura kijaniata]|uniref:class I SAM-dependent methyltransferase n=1 Tax=Actinomadura kijaniata TaxID=46161 RepID=UPI00082D400F|nr:class I SAM-dependent methyltransferase [Actinomadura kijaniata]